MASRERYRELLENVRRAHLDFKNAYRRAKAGGDKDSKGLGKAEAEREEFYKHLRILSGLLEDIRKRVQDGGSEAIDDLIEYLAVDIPAFRSGYAKERFYRQLKKVPLTQAQINQLREIAVARCASTEYRRDDSELRRVMIRLADLNFLNRVAAIPALPGSRIEGQKRRMFQVVLGGRKDLSKRLLETESGSKTESSEVAEL